MDYESIFQDMLKDAGVDALDLDDKESIIKAVYHPDKDIMMERIQATIYCSMLWVTDVLETLDGLRQIYRELEG